MIFIISFLCLYRGQNKLFYITLSCVYTMYICLGVMEEDMFYNRVIPSQMCWEIEYC